MRNWPENKYSLAQRTRRLLAERLLEQALHRRSRSKFWDRLAAAADHFLVPFEGDQPALPDSVAVNLSTIAFAEMYFSEEFGDAELGMHRLVGARRRPFSPNSRAEIHSFF